MGRITTEIRYKNMSFQFMRTVNDLKLYFNQDDHSFAIITNEHGDVLFEISVNYSHMSPYLKDELSD